MLYKDDVISNVVSHGICFGTRFQHFKGGFYIGICEAIREGDGTSVTVYQCEKSKKIYTRPTVEFYDAVKHEGRVVSRFVPVDQAR